METPLFAAEAADDWQYLTRWERAEIGRKLRRLGWTYGEIMDVIPVGKGTLAGWCREIRLSEEQIAAIKARVPSQKGVPKDTNWKRRLEIERIREQAKAEVPVLISDPLWVSGTVMYWAEGDKSSRRLSVVNTDARVLRLFIRWTSKYLIEDPEFILALHLHHGNNEEAAKQYWVSSLRLNNPRFHKTFIKPPGTGHRKNHLAHGICRVRAQRSGDGWNRVMAWIDSLAEWGHW